MALFRGNCTPSQAHVWLRTLERTWHYDTPDAEKLYQFEKNLHPGGEADGWWDGLGVEERDTWGGLVVAFERKWPSPSRKREKAKATTEEELAEAETRRRRAAVDAIIEELGANTLHLHELGQYEYVDGAPVLTHVAWAERTRTLLAEFARRRRRDATQKHGPRHSTCRVPVPRRP
ncbi:hypothetical protein B0H12DRAFT_1245179 [Mycena haematopus]|nr:hypothetical protein B0H12DRAFT_1245179 [Mycena haematopus]